MLVWLGRTRIETEIVLSILMINKPTLFLGIDILDK